LDIAFLNGYAKRAVIPIKAIGKLSIPIKSAENITVDPAKDNKIDFIIVIPILS